MWNLAVPEGVTLHALEQTESTNTVAKQIAEGGASNFSLVVAKSQTAGRGRHGREWISPEGNVFWSMILRITDSTQEFGTLPFVAGLSVYDALTKLTGKPELFMLKWPNDILLNDCKISGILIETSPGGQVFGTNLPGGPWAVVGIGINVSHYPTANTRYPATSLHKENFSHISRDKVIFALTSAFVERFNQWNIGGYDSLKDDLTRAMGGIGQEITVRMSDQRNEDLHGIFMGLDQSGLLILRKENGEVRHFSVGDVFLTRKPK